VLSDTELDAHARLAEALEELRAHAVVILGNAPCAPGFDVEDHWDAASLAASDAALAAADLMSVVSAPQCGCSRDVLAFAVELTAVVGIIAVDLGALDANRLGHTRLEPAEAAQYASLLPFSIAAAFASAGMLRTERGLPS
jgi:hypothetical protein